MSSAHPAYGITTGSSRPGPFSVTDRDGDRSLTVETPTSGDPQVWIWVRDLTRALVFGMALSAPTLRGLAAHLTRVADALDDDRPTPSQITPSTDQAGAPTP